MKIIQSLCWFPLVLTFASTVWATSGKALIALGRLLMDSHELGSSLWIGILDSATYPIILQLWEMVPSFSCWSWRWWKAFCDPLFPILQDNIPIFKLVDAKILSNLNWVEFLETFQWIGLKLLYICAAPKLLSMVLKSIPKS